MQLVFHQAALGDFVLALPTLRRLSSEDGPVTLVVPWSHGRVAARLMPEARVLDAEMFEFTRLWAPGGPSTVSPAVAEVFSESRRVLNFVAEPGSDWETNVARLCGNAPVLTVLPRPDHTWDRPLRDWHARQLEDQRIALIAENDATLHGEPLMERPETDPTPRTWAIHPGSGGVAKCWPVARFAEMAAALRDTGDNVRFLLGPAELERGIDRKLAEALDDPGAFDTRTIREIDDLFFALADRTHYLGNDAGPTHVAAQLGLHVTALFGPSDWRVWAPVGPRVRLVAPTDPTLITWLSVDELADRLGVR